MNPGIVQHPLKGRGAGAPGNGAAARVCQAGHRVAHIVRRAAQVVAYPAAAHRAVISVVSVCDVVVIVQGTAAAGNGVISGRAAVAGGTAVAAGHRVIPVMGAIDAIIVRHVVVVGLVAGIVVVPVAAGRQSQDHR